jgi:hypothetical protein
MPSRHPLHPVLVFAIAILVVGAATQSFVAYGADAEPEKTNLVYSIDSKDQSLLPLESVVSKMTTSVNSSGSAEGQMTIPGEKSAVRVKPAPAITEFIVRPADPSAYFGIKFERFKVEGGKRVLKYAMSMSPASSADQPGLLAIDTDKTGKSVKIDVNYPLPPGEYGFTVSPHGGEPKVFCFGVD